MFKFTSHLDFLQFDKLSYTKTLDRVLGQIIREAAREWLRAWLSLGVPVETGMAKSSLLPLGRYLKNVGGLGFTPTRKPYKNSSEVGGFVSPEAGEAYSQFVIMDDKTSPKEFLYWFEWSTEVLHYYFNERYRGDSPSGQEALDYAEEAFTEYINEAIARRLPNAAEFIGFTTQLRVEYRG